MKLTTEQIREFYHRGYVKIPGAISKSMVDTARQAINYSIGTLSPKGLNLAKHRPNRPVTSIIWAMGETANQKVPITGASPASASYISPMYPSLTMEISQSGPGPITSMKTISIRRVLKFFPMDSHVLTSPSHRT